MRHANVVLLSSLAFSIGTTIVACSSEDPNALNGGSETTSEDLRRHRSRCASDDRHEREDEDRVWACDAGAPRDSGTTRVDSGALVDSGASIDAGAAMCNSFTYSTWGACQPNGTQSRTVVTSSPAGCTGGTPVLTQTCTPPVSLANQVQPILTAHCALSGCHNSGGLAPNLSAGNTYNSTVNVSANFCSTAKYVVPGQPAQSWLVTKITSGGTLGTCSGGSMAGFLSSSADAATISRWITEGANNN